MHNENSVIAAMIREESDRNILVDYRRARIGYPFKGQQPTVEQERELAHQWIREGRIPFSLKSIKADPFYARDRVTDEIRTAWPSKRVESPFEAGRGSNGWIRKERVPTA